MSLSPSTQETIFALATGARKAALAVFRISGSLSRHTLETLSPQRSYPARQAVLQTIYDPKSGDAIDRALITRFEQPSSFTGEDAVEIGVTGGPAVTSAVVQALSSIPGVRPAEPGEFAWRAFVNGKLDLSEVEGLADLVDAETDAQRRQAQRIAGGALRRECEQIRAALLSAMVEIEGQLDFSDVEDSAALTPASAIDAILAAKGRLDQALRTAGVAQKLRHGFVVVIAGPPNVGKSTLMNVLAGRDIAITSPVAGTTRDPIEVFLDLNGYPVSFVDTAGVRTAEDPIEQEGVARTLKRIQSADLMLWLDDGTGGGADPPNCTRIDVLTKADLITQSAASAALKISAVTGQGIEVLLRRVSEAAAHCTSASEPAVLVLERHRRSFEEARDALISALSGPASLELIAEDIRQAVKALDRLVGRIGVEDVLDGIFSRLCVGK